MITAVPDRMQADWLQWTAAPALEDVTSGHGHCRRCRASFPEVSEFGTWRTHVCADMEPAPVFRVRHLGRQRDAWADVPEWVRPGSPVRSLARMDAAA